MKISTPIRVPGMPIRFQGKLWTVLAVSPDSLFLIGTYGQIVEVKPCKESNEAMAA